MSELARRDEDLRPGPHHRSPETGTGRLLVAAAVVVLLIAVAAGTTWWMYTRDPVEDPVQAAVKATAPHCPEPSLRVVAAPEIAPVVVEAAHTIGPPTGGCRPVEVIAEEPAVTAAATNRKVDVWIPSSSAWLAAATGAGTPYTTEGEPLARTPILLAAPTAIAPLFAEGDQTSWARLTAGAASQQIPAVTMPNPQRSTVGLLSVFAVNAAMRRSTADEGIAQLRALTLRSRLREAEIDSAALVSGMAAEWNTNRAVSEVGVFPITEQQLAVYRRGDHVVQLTGAYPSDGLVEADYPFAVAKTLKDRELAERLRSAIGRGALSEAGFRTYATKNALTVPDAPGPMLAAAKLWSGYRPISSQVLLLIDASGSMNESIKDASGRTTTTRAGLLRESGRAAAQVFSNDTSIGMWYFGSPTRASPPHTEAVPFGPISAEVDGEPRRAALTAAMTRYRVPKASGTPLYQSVLDASAEMQTRAKQGTVSLVVVLTDGVDGESKYAMTPAEFRRRLTAQRDPARPVPVIAVGYGPDADMKTLTEMAKSTGGKAIAAANPADLASAMAKAFLAAHAG
ncbi:MAG TPA: substrate-binding domain-containing protein [Actinoplanes sp.]